MRLRQISGQCDLWRAPINLVEMTERMSLLGAPTTGLGPYRTPFPAIGMSEKTSRGQPNSFGHVRLMVV